MAELIRRLLRAFGRDLVPYPPESRDSARLVQILQRAGVTVVFDVGANVGQYAQRLRRHGYRGRIVSIEPGPEAHRALEKQAARDNSWIVAPPMALGADPGHGELRVTHSSDMSSLRPMLPEFRSLMTDAAEIARAEIPVERFDQVLPRYAEEGDAAFLKVDTQGFERDVLDGAEGVLDRLAGLQLEMSIVPIYEGEATYLELIERVTRRGFEPVLFLPGYFSRRLGRQLQLDGVFVRASPARA